MKLHLKRIACVVALACAALAGGTAFAASHREAPQIANDPAAADPVCPKSPHHGLVQQAVAQAEQGGAVVEQPLVFRDPAQSRRLAREAATGSAG